MLSSSFNHLQGTKGLPNYLEARGRRVHLGWRHWVIESPLTFKRERQHLERSRIGANNEDQEQEADWLAGCLLLPRDALLAIRRRRLSDEETCSEYGVSPAMLRFESTSQR